MFWADKLAKNIIETGKHIPYHVDDMFTPSGFAHVGSLRGPLVHDMVYRALVNAKKDTRTTFVFNDFDPIDGLPSDLAEKFSQYMGMPLRTVPSPVEGYESFAHYFTSDFQNVLGDLGVAAEFLSSWDMYHEGEFNGVIVEALDHAGTIGEIYHKVSGSKKKDKEWLPFQVICEKCGKLGTTRVHGWDGTFVTYTCEPDMVSWAKGCGYQGKISPLDGNGKLLWKVDWPAHWKVMGVSIEGAGKDHSSAGGSRDIARELCKDVFSIPEAFNMPYEFFLIGGKKMSSSKGLGLKARDLTSVLPASVARFLFTRTDYRQAIEFDPVETMGIPDVFDEYDRAWQAYIDGSDLDLSASFFYAQIGDIPDPTPKFLPRFRDVANYIQLPGTDIAMVFAKQKGSALTKEEERILKERSSYAKTWLTQFASEDVKFMYQETLPEDAKHISDEQKKYLEGVFAIIDSEIHADDLQTKLYEAAKSMNIPVKEAFKAIYMSLIGKTHGPRAGALIRSLPKEQVISRFQEVVQRSK